MSSAFATGVVPAFSRPLPRPAAERIQTMFERKVGILHMPAVIIWSLTLCSVAFFMLCDSLITHWAKTSSFSSLATVIVLSPVAYLFFGFVTSRANLAVGGAMVNLMLVIGAVLVGFFYFKESITTWQWTGISLGMVSILILGTSVQK